MFEELQKKKDFSKKSINKEVVKRSTEHPVVVYPAAAGIVGLAGLFLLGSGPLMLGMLIGGGAVAGLSWLINMTLRREAISSRFVEELLNSIEQERGDKIQSLGKNLVTSGHKTANEQFDRVQQKFDTFRGILENKFKTSELTFTRFMGSAEQVFLGVLDNLQAVLETVKANEAIDINNLNQRLKSIKRNGVEDREKREYETLVKRKDIYNEQLRKIDELYILNEEAMTELDKTMDAITNIKGRDRQSNIDLESAMEYLQDMAKRTQQFD